MNHLKSTKSLSSIKKAVAIALLPICIINLSPIATEPAVAETNLRENDEDENDVMEVAT